MSSREASRAAAEPAPTPSSEPPRQRPADAVAVPASVQRFYTHFMTLLTQQGRCGPATIAAAVSTPSAPLQHRSTSTTDGQDGTEDNALRRLTCAQEDALGPLLWQWLVLFSLAVQQAGEAPQERGPAPSAMAVASAMCSATPSHALGPHDVERLFRSGFSSLLPVAGSGGGAGGLRGSRMPPADPPAPWHSVPLAKQSGPERALVAALSAISCNGPLFSAWCALCYTCVGASLLVSTSQRRHEGGDAAAGLSTSGFSASEEAIRSALRRLRHAWNSAVELADAPRRSVDACATLRLWATVYTTCTALGSAAEAAPITHEKAGESRALQAPPLSLSLWAVQWYRECTRVAAHGADEGFHSEEAGVPVELVTRVMRYMCHRLEAEVVRRARRHERTGSAASLTATAELEEARAKTTAPVLTAPPSEASAPAPIVPTLRVGALTALALQSVMHLVGDDADRRGGAAKRSGGRKGGAPLRRRRRAWQMSSDDDDGSDVDSSVEDPDYGGGTEGSWSGRTDAQSGASRFIFSQQERYEVAIASGVLTTYSVCPADDDVAQPADRHYMHRLTGEQYLRNGTVHWWTLRDSQRHRQLMAEARNTS
ncbi:hypothetical protein, conserved [Leishmania donovani]|uniref:Uncharacterized protein n=1 Tax=Leishmania donovani TaxID=5661 RepID=E9BA10_LEIDO|nr:hypothetical protein, conserved [Leishmania donovani]AYU76566.1 hypothetical protein LdCL_090018900 [Leishmania donovani]CBZ32083.1 hypothetical protein, conserved [Leishmania donovani]